MKLSYEELESRCAALAAENAGLKAAISCHAAGFTVCEACGEENTSGNDDVCSALNETPATDSFLAEVRAQIAEEALKIMGNFTSDECGDSVYIAVKEFAENLRKGVQS